MLSLSLNLRGHLLRLAPHTVCCITGLKRHSVTLFEGGRVGGAAVIDELITELAASAAAGEFFEGDMVQVKADTFAAVYMLVGQ
jgi:hypothetical protein